MYMEMQIHVRPLSTWESQTWASALLSSAWGQTLRSSWSHRNTAPCTQNSISEYNRNTIAEQHSANEAPLSKAGGDVPRSTHTSDEATLLSQTRYEQITWKHKRTAVTKY